MRVAGHDAIAVVVARGAGRALGLGRERVADREREPFRAAAGATGPRPCSGLPAQVAARVTTSRGATSPAPLQPAGLLRVALDGDEEPQAERDRQDAD